MSDREVVVLSAVRTAVGKFGGALKDIPPTELAAKVICQGVQRSGLSPNDVGHVVFGNVIHTEAKDMYLSRVAAMRAGLLDADSIRQRALAGAWQLVARDGVDDAGIVVHGALDLYHVEHLPIPAPEQAEALVQLAGLPASPMRTALMERFGIG